MMTDCTAVGDEVVIMIMMMLSMVMMCISLSFHDWLIDVRCIRVGLGDTDPQTILVQSVRIDRPMCARMWY